MDGPAATVAAVALAMAPAVDVVTVVEVVVAVAVVSCVKSGNLVRGSPVGPYLRWVCFVRGPILAL